MATMNRITVKTSILANIFEFTTSCFDSSSSKDNTSETARQCLMFNLDKDNNLVVLGTSKETEIEATIKADDLKIEGDIAKQPFLLPAKKVHTLIKSAPKDGDISIRCMSEFEYVVTFSGLKSKYKVNTLDPTLLPTFVVDKSGASCFEVNSQEFCRTLSTISFAMANQDVRYYLNGIQLLKNNESEKMLLTATDGHRLAQNKLEFTPVKNADDFDVIISRKLATQIPPLLKGTNSDVVIALTNNLFLMRFNNGSFECVVRSLVVDGKFPEWKRVLVDTFNYSAIVPRDTLKSSTQRSLIFSNEKHRGCTLSFTGTELTISANAKSANSVGKSDEAEETIGIESNIKDSYAFALNGAYLIDVLSHFLSSEFRSYNDRA